MIYLIHRGGQSVRLGNVRKQVNRMRSACPVDPCKIPVLRLKGRKLCARRRERPWLLGHGKTCKEHQLVLDDRPAYAAAKIIEMEWGLLLSARVVHPGICVQRGVAVIFKKPPVKAVGSAPRDEIYLKIRLSIARIRIELVRLDRHLFHVLDASLHQWL